MEGAEFCVFCGNAVTDGARIVSMECEQCGGTMVYDDEQNQLICPYCGHRSLLLGEDAPEEPKESPMSGTESQRRAVISLLTVVVLVAAIAGLVAIFRALKPNLIQWDQLYLGDRIPGVYEKRIEMISNSDEWLSVEIMKVSQSEYYEYVRACEEEYGFTIDVRKDESNFEGFTEDGYGLYIFYWEGSMDIDLDAPKDFRPYELPEYAIAEGLPKPESEMGCYSSCSDDWLWLYVADTTYEEFLAYAQTCKEAGFAPRVSIDEYDFNGVNENGWELELRYEGNSTISITLSAPE